VNVKEAEKVVELVKSIVAKKDHGTIGIITFNAKQQALINDMLEKTDDKNIKKEFELVNSKNEDVSLFVKNIENVQGDERDIIIFSIGYAKDINGKFSNSFGPINTKGGKNRINVAISRAKNKIYVVKSIKHD
jgi:superfamily I DNA and/or RNA helicase